MRMDEGGNEPFCLGAASVVGSTDRALKVLFDSSSVIGERQIWIPKSVIHDDSEVFDGGRNASGDLVVKQWFARKEGWATE